MIQGIIITLPLFVTLFWSVTLWLDSGSGGNPKRVLALFMTIACVLYSAHAIFFAMDIELYAVIDPAYTFASLSVFPLFYIYIKSLTEGTGSFGRNLIILSPAIFFSFASILLYTIMGREESLLFVKKFIYNQPVVHEFSTTAIIHDIVYKAGRITFALQLVPCTYFSLKKIETYEKSIRDFYSSTENKSLAWTGNMLWATVLAALFALILNIIGKSYFVSHYLLISIPSLLFSLLLYTIGYLGIKQFFYVEDYKSDLKKEKNNTNHHDTSRSKLYGEILELLEKEMIFRNPELRITDLSKVLKSNRTYISAIVNTEFKSTFCDLINHYRVEYAKKLLLDQKLYILEYISNESGFASINSFLRAFRKETGTTPGEYRKLNIKNH
jgi:AraC-like DNA-binding protein